MNKRLDQDSVLIGLVGAGGFAREVMPLLEVLSEKGETLAQRQKTELVFVETSPTKIEVNGRRVVSEEEFIAAPNISKYFNIAIADSKGREAIANRLTDAGIQPLSIEANSHLDFSSNHIGEGAILCANTIVTSNAKIGKYFHANIHSYVAHDCVIGDFVTFAPRVCCNGNIHIGNHAYIGTGAILKQGSADKPLIIGEGAIVGMGAVVTKNVQARTTVIGNPAKPLETKK